MNSHVTIAEPIGGWQEPWPRAFEIAAQLPPDRWALVGGLMVQSHAMANEVETTRVTTDVDAAVRIEAGVYRYTEAAAVVTQLGYTVDTSTGLSYRFLRGAERIDLMVADHEQPAPRHSQRDVMTLTGGQQALSRVEPVHFEVGESEAVLPVPNLHGALVLKAAAYTVDTRDRDRHLEDAITLFACIVDIAPILGGLQGSDRKRILRVIRALDDRPLIAAQVPSDTLQLALRTIEEFRAAFS